MSFYGILFFVKYGPECSRRRILRQGRSRILLAIITKNRQGQERSPLEPGLIVCAVKIVMDNNVAAASIIIVY